MKILDIILVIAILGILILCGYLSFFKHRKSPCKGCPYAKGCSGECDKNKQKKENNKN